MNGWRSILGFLCLAFFCGCGARLVKFKENGVTCTEAQSLAIAAVGRMGYAVGETRKPLPGIPGMIRATRTLGTERQSMYVQVFCTRLGAEVEAKTENGAGLDLSFANDFRRAYETARASKPAMRVPQGQGLDVAVTLEPGTGSSALPFDLSASGTLPVHVRVSNQTSRRYRFKVGQVVLYTTGGEKVKALPVEQATRGLAEADAATLRSRVLKDIEVAEQAELDGFLFFPMQPYTRARVTLKDVKDGEPEGFSINF